MSSGALGMLSFSLDVLKPRYSEAVARLKNSLMALFALVVLTHLLPVPPLYSALWRVYRGSYRSFPHKVISLSEFWAFSILAFNILQASYAIYSPRKPHAPPPTPAKPLSILQSPRATPSAPAWRSKSHGLSPNTTPQRQKAFAPSASYTPSDPLNLARSYTLSFFGPSSDASFASSVSLPPSPSPLAAYRGRQGGAIGRPLDASLLARLSQMDSDDE
ncbi:hypothetical protein HETIRDRAFT_435293 [Heterobasidion irregulare TC 32-1]|uniref:Uncharacterized protein n=1 Tax=Heterobasidion irregulare (strain TC 32-1) TaxID=747525 RepID=W4JY57_HETIT|nr:uncharacterized protein HETIRDRAFT_435293 [Heterobasidion irregulare TC 32-1]ETW78517.1 hypothetical protein HETIRDRAFT_435293 [Heterobasidion irregulare TC 32-1]